MAKRKRLASTIPDVPSHSPDRPSSHLPGRSWVSVAEARQKKICYWCGSPAVPPEFDPIRTNVPSCGCAERLYKERLKEKKDGN